MEAESAIARTEDQWIEGFAEVFQRFMRVSVELCQYFVEMESKCPEAARKLIRENRWLRLQAPAFRRVGSGVLPEEALTYSEKELRLLDKFPIEDQRRIITEGAVDVLADDGTTYHVKLDEMSTDVARQVLADDHIRSESEQRQWMEQRRTKERAKALEPIDYVPDFYVRDNMIVIPRGIKMPLDDFLAELKRKAGRK